MCQIRNIVLPIRHLFVATGMLAALCACTSDKESDDAPVEPPPPPPVPVVEQIPLTIDVKLTGEAAASGFGRGDDAGLYVVNHAADGSAQPLKSTGNYVDNGLYLLQDTWIADNPICWKDSVTHADFYIYSPYMPTVQSVESMPWSVRLDQTDKDDYLASRLLIGRRLDVVPTRERIVMDVSLATARIVVELKAGKGFTEASLAESDVNVSLCRMKTQAVADLVLGNVVAVGPVADIATFKADATNWQAIVVPQALDEGSQVKVTLDGTEYTLPLTSKFDAIESGRSYQLTISVSQTGEGVNIGIIAWKDDGKDYGGTAEY